MTKTDDRKTPPNILMIVSDQERARGWIPDDLHSQLKGRTRLIETGLECGSHYTHSSPCSPSRATLFCGQYVPEHGVTDNVFIDPAHPDLHDQTPTIGHLLRRAGYKTAFIGKWHLSWGNPEMERYGFSDWSGQDWAWTGLAGTGVYYDQIIAGQATEWIRAHAHAGPWLLVVGLLNPHDIAWYPADQPGYQARHPERSAQYRSYIPAPIPGKESITTFTGEFAELFDLPANHLDDLNSKPAVQKTWRWEENHWHFGWLDHDDSHSWRRALDYYWELHKRNDAHVVEILDALAATGHEDETAVIFTSDHGEMAGSHGMRGKGPFAYEEIMHIPLYMRVPGVTTPGTRTESLTSSVDLVQTMCAIAGADPGDSVSGVDISPLMSDTSASVRDHVLFAQEQGWHQSCVAERFALRGYFDGQTKYVRYYGVGGGTDSIGRGVPWQDEMRFGPNADVFDLEHELYDLTDDPGELENLALAGSRSHEIDDRIAHLRELEKIAYVHERPAGRGQGSSGESGMMAHAGIGDG